MGCAPEAPKEHTKAYTELRSSGTVTLESLLDDWNQGYGYQMWCCTHGAYRLDGAWSQLCIVIPEKHAVVACLSHSPNGARMLNSVWTNVYDNL